MNTDDIIFSNLQLGCKIGFSIQKYQFPEIRSDYDANWLQVRITCECKEHSFTATDPALLTTDLVEIGDWFEAIARNEIPTHIELDFIEPNIRFVLFRSTRGKVGFGIDLAYEHKPTFGMKAVHGDEFESDDFRIWFECSHNKMRDYANAFRVLSKVYPPRGDEFALKMFHYKSGDTQTHG